MKRIFKWIAGFVGLVVASLFGGVFLLQTKERPVPDILVGYHQTEIEVAHRDGPLPVHVWYPARSDGTVELIGQNALFYGFHARRDATALVEAAPVIVLSHGSGGRGQQMGWLATALAAQGFVVIGTDHPGTRSQDSDPFQTVRIWERPADMSALLDYLEATPPQGISPDMTWVTSLGFSLGGHSALALGGLRVSRDRFIAYCDANVGLFDCGWMQAAGVDFTQIDQTRYEASHRDARVVASIAIDPALPQAVAEAGLDDLVPDTLILNLGETDRVPAAMRADGLAQAAQATYLSIPGAAHFSFLPDCSVLGGLLIGLAGEDNICSDRGLRDRQAVHDDILQGLSGFLEQLRQTKG